MHGNDEGVVVTLAADPEFSKAQFCYRTSIHPSTQVGPGWRLGLLRKLRLGLSLPEPTVSW